MRVKCCERVSADDVFRRSLVCFLSWLLLGGEWCGCSHLLNLSEITSGTDEVKAVTEGDNAEIKCRPSDPGSMIIWFRVRDKSGMEFIASFSSNGMPKPNTKSPSSTFIDSKIGQNILILQSFKEAVDSGVYSCATLYKGTELRFGEVTRLVGGELCFINLVSLWYDGCFSVPLSSHICSPKLKKKQPKRPRPQLTRSRVDAQKPRYASAATVTRTVNVTIRNSV